MNDFAATQRRPEHVLDQNLSLAHPRSANEGAARPKATCGWFRGRLKPHPSLSALLGMATLGLATPMCAAPGEERAIGISSYHLDVKAYPESHRLVITATESLTGEAGQQAALAFSLHQNFKINRVAQGERALDFTRTGGTIRIPEVRAGTNAPPLRWEYEGTFNPPPFKEDAMPAIIVAPDEVRMTYTAPWYPALKGAATGNRPSSSLAIELPAGFVAASGDDQAGPPETASGRTRYQFTSSGHGSLSFCAARYQMKRLNPGGLEVRAYYFPKKPEAPENDLQLSMQRPQEVKDVQQVLEMASDILDFFSQTFSPYFSGGFSLVQKSAHRGYAYGVSTYVVMNGFNRCDERFLAHEIAHQWWGNLIHPVGGGERWLTESFAEYSAFLYLQHKRGETDVEKDDRGSLVSQTLNCAPIRKTSFQTPDYDGIIYKIGPYVFHALRYVMGDEEFFALLKAFARDYARRSATVADFIGVAERVHKQSLAWFFNDWLDHTQAPQFILESSVITGGTGDATIKGKVIQNRTEYRLPLRLEVIGTGQSVTSTQTLWVTGKETPFEYTVSGHPQGIRFAESMSTWILGDFFNSAAEASQARTRTKPPPHPDADELIQSLRKQVKVTRPYQLGEAITLTLAPKETTLLKCGDNAFGLREILLCPQEGYLYHYAIWNEGRISGGGRALHEGHCFNPAAPDLGFLRDWEIKDNQVVVRYQAVTDAEELQRLAAKRKPPTQKK